MKTKKELSNTNDSNSYRKLRKEYLVNKGKVNCSFCKFHKGENRKRRVKRNWKKYRKTQYRTSSTAVSVLGFHPSDKSSNLFWCSKDDLVKVLRKNIPLGFITTEDILDMLNELGI